MKFYHGAKNKIDRFEIANKFMTDETIMQEGPGIYLTSSIEDAQRYGQYIHEVEWKPKKRLPTKKTSYPMAHYRVFLLRFIKKSPDWKDSAMNWDENPDKGVRDALDSILESYETPKERFEQIWYDFYRNDPALYCQNMARVGYDGFIIEKNNGVKHAIVFNPSTIHILNVQLLEHTKTRYLNNKQKLNLVVQKIEQLTNKKVNLG